MILAVLLLAIVPLPVIAEERVDCLELNVIYDGDSGHEILTQIIFWEFDRGVCRVQAWRMYKGWPIERSEAGWLMRFHDGDALREIRATHFARTWRTWDEEVRQREVCPAEFRRELYTARKR